MSCLSASALLWKMSFGPETTTAYLEYYNKNFIAVILLVIITNRFDQHTLELEVKQEEPWD